MKTFNSILISDNLEFSSPTTNRVRHQVDTSKQYSINYLHTFLDQISNSDPKALVFLESTVQDSVLPRSQILYSDGTIGFEDGTPVKLSTDRIQLALYIINSQLFLDRSYEQSRLNLSDGECNNCYKIIFWDFGTHTNSTIHIFPDEEMTVFENEIIIELEDIFYDTEALKSE